jgi:hypothetical protein
LPTSYKSYPDLRIAATLRFRDRAESTLIIPIKIPSGLYQYTINRDDFFRTGGILTYKLELFGNNCLQYQWRHMLWVDLITVGEATESGPEERN